MSDLIKQELDDWLDKVNYKELDNYIPTDFALTFMNFIKLVNGSQGESHKTPPVHLKMLDKVVNGRDYIANLCFRGASKTTVFAEYLSLYLGVFNFIPGFGHVDGMIYVSDSMDNGVKSVRKNIEFRYNNSAFLQEWIPQASFTDNYIEFTNRNGGKLGMKMFGAKSGIRGTKIFGKRPSLCVLDDLVSDDDAKSQTSMQAIKDTVYKGVLHALDPSKRKIIFNGTPFNKNDILIEAVESGVWDVNVWPICERFPCTKEEFVGAWEDRFPYEFVKSQYDLAEGTGKLSSFYQELMLRITSEDERLVQESEIRWYERSSLLQLKNNFNFYITTDFATSSKQTADYSVISVWAFNNNMDWFWVDGIAKKQSLDKTLDDLFNLVATYKPQAVGIEINGQQNGFIPYIQREMLHRNIWFNFASNSKGNEPGIRSVGDKLSRFNLVVPWFKAGKMFFPSEMRTSAIMKLFMEQLRFVTVSGIKSKDDCIDTISQLAMLKPWKPSEASQQLTRNDDGIWEAEEQVSDESALSSYIY